MKFLAVLKDSLREAVDTKVFYVMVGLSVLVTLLTATMTFTPKAAGLDLAKIAAAPLFLENLNEKADSPEEFFRRLEKADKGVYEVVSATPADGSSDAPSSRFKVVLRMTPTPAMKGKTDAELIEHIQARYGKIDTLALYVAEDVRAIERPEGVERRSGQERFFELTAKPTSLTYRWWPHSWSLF